MRQSHQSAPYSPAFLRPSRLIRRLLRERDSDAREVAVVHAEIEVRALDVGSRDLPADVFVRDFGNLDPQNHGAFTMPRILRIRNAQWTSTR